MNPALWDMILELVRDLFRNCDENQRRSILRSPRPRQRRLFERRLERRATAPRRFGGIMDEFEFDAQRRRILDHTEEYFRDCGEVQLSKMFEEDEE